MLESNFCMFCLQKNRTNRIEDLFLGFSIMTIYISISNIILWHYDKNNIKSVNAPVATDTFIEKNTFITSRISDFLYPIFVPLIKDYYFTF